MLNMLNISWHFLENAKVYRANAAQGKLSRRRSIYQLTCLLDQLQSDGSGLRESRMDWKDQVVREPETSQNKSCHEVDGSGWRWLIQVWLKNLSVLDLRFPLKSTERSWSVNLLDQAHDVQRGLSAVQMSPLSGLQIHWRDLRILHGHRDCWRKLNDRGCNNYHNYSASWLVIWQSSMVWRLLWHDTLTHLRFFNCEISDRSASSECIWTDPPVELQRTPREEKEGRVCWDYVVPVGTKVQVSGSLTLSKAEWFGLLF